MERCARNGHSWYGLDQEGMDLSADIWRMGCRYCDKRELWSGTMIDGYFLTGEFKEGTVAAHVQAIIKSERERKQQQVESK
jgi:hypothetical protein